MVPESLPILYKLREHALLNVYAQAGLQVGVLGCGYSVGMWADKAGEGEVWLSWQIGTLKRRMGPGRLSPRLK